MKPKLHPLIAAPFLALSGYLLFESISAVISALNQGWGAIGFAALFGTIVVAVAATPGVLALQRRWGDFVKFVSVLVLILLFIPITAQVSRLADAIKAFADPEHPLLYSLWGLSVSISPFVICIVAYRRFVPRILRHIPSATPITHSHSPLADGK